MSIYYASNLGGGTGALQSSPFQIGNFWSVAQPGDTLYLLDGVYTGANSMINPTAGLSGTSGSPITVRALNDGGVRLNGQGARTPILLQQNDYFILRGFDFHNSDGAAAYIYQSDYSQLLRLCGWDAAAGNNHVFSYDQCVSPLSEDCFGFGRGRKIFEGFSSQTPTFRRCYFIWTETTQSGPVGMELTYNANGTTAENCIGTWRRTGSAPSGAGGIFGWTGASSGADDSKLLGSIAYVRSSYNVDTNLIVAGNNGYVNIDMANVAAYVQPGSHLTRLPFSLNNASAASGDRLTSIGGDTDAFGNWTITNHVDSATTVSIFSGSGAIINFRYVDRTLTADPLWPWPMDQRIKAALIAAGHPSVTDGFTNDTGLLTDAIEEMFGTIPAEAEGDPPPEDDPFEEEDPPAGSPSRGTEWHTLCKIFLDSGTKYYSKKEVNHPVYVYEGRIKSFGFVDRSIPVPSGLPQLGDCRIQVIDTDMALRDVLAHETPRRRFIELRNVPEGGSESAHPPFATFEIYDFELANGIVEISGRDVNFSWIDNVIPGLINRTNFPDLMPGIDEAFMPIIAGVLDAPDEGSPPNPQGVLTLPRMTLTRWGLAQHPILYVELCGRLTNEDLFTEIDPGDYTVTEEPHTIDGVDYTLSFIDFTVDQDPGLEVRCRIVEGFATRGAFGNMPAVINSPLTALRNPVDAWINVVYGTLARETRIPRFNTDSFLEVHALFDSGLIDYVSPAAPYACDFAIDEPITIREFMSWWQTSFETDVYVNRYGEIEMNVTTVTDPDRPVFSQGPVFGNITDDSLILLNTVRQRSANPTCNRLRYNSAYNYSEEEWAQKDVFDNEDDQLALGGAGSPIVPFIEESDSPLELRCVRDPLTATDVARRRMEFLALGSYRIEFQAPLPYAYNDLELARLIGVTSVWGLEVGGYHNQEIKVTGLTYELDRKVVTVRGILRVPQSIALAEPEPPESLLFTGETYIEGLDFGITAQASPATYQRSMFYVPQSGYDLTKTTLYLEAVASNLDGSDRVVTVYPVLSLGASITVGTGQTITIPASTSGRVRSSTPFSPFGGSELYIVEMPAGTTFNLYRIRVVTDHDEVDKFASEIYFSISSSATGLDQTIGGGDIARTTSAGLPSSTSGFVTINQPRWTYEAARWSTVTRFHFWAIVANASFDMSTRWSEVILYDLTAAAYLEASRLICADGNMFLAPRPFSVDIPIAAFTDGHTYEVQIRSVKTDLGFGDFNTYFHKARGHIYLDPLGSHELHQRCGNATGVVEERTRYAPLPSIPAADVLVELHGTVGTMYGLRDYGTSDTTTTGTVRAFGEAVIEDSVKKFARTQDISQFATQGNRFAAPDVAQASLIHRYPRIAPVFPLTTATSRQRYVEYLFNQGYMPALAVLFEEGTGTPTEFIRGSTMSVGGSATWTVDGTYGTAGRAPGINDYWTIDNVAEFIVPTERCTVLIIRKKADSTKRDSNLCGIYNGAGVFFGDWLTMNIPVSSSGGLARWNVGSNDLTVAFTVSTNVETLACKFGPSGRAIWRDGVSIASDATVVTRGPADPTDDFAINRGSSNYSNGDIQDFYFFALIRAEVPDAILATFTANNVLLLF